MLAMLEKLINEHGSSTILKERLELFSDKYTMLEEKNKHLSERNEELESKLDKAKEEINRLNEIIEANAISQSQDKLDEVQEKILQFLFKEDDEIEKDQLARILDIEPGVMSYHFDVLEEKDLICVSSMQMGNPMTGSAGGVFHAITPDGRKYVVENVRT